MNIIRIKDYLHKLAGVHGLNSDFHNFAISFIDFCESNNFINYMRESRFESSLLVKGGKFKARFVHYLDFKENLHLKIKKISGYLSAFRIVKMLKAAGFPYVMAMKTIYACGNLWEDFPNTFPNTIVSAEWDMNIRKFDKFTLYINCEKSFGMKICSFFSDMLNFDRKIIYEMSRDIVLFAIDFFESGDISFKIYNRFPVNSKFKAQKWEEKPLDVLKKCQIKSVIRVNRFFPKNKKILKNHKTHFLIRGMRFPAFQKLCKINTFEKMIPILKDKNVVVVSIDQKSIFREIYFD